MNFVTPNKEEINPFYQLLLLFGYSIAGVIIFTILSLGIILPFYGFGILKEVMTSQISQDNVGAFKILQTLSTPIGMMLVPAVFLAFTEKQKVTDFYPFAKPRWALTGIALLIILASNPIIEWSGVINQKMVLPGFLKGIEDWMREKEDATAKIMTELITVRSTWGFIVNLFVIAVMPAIGEELMFRGGVQRAVQRIFGNPHIAIWISAIIFSAIHVQFYGFLPRMLLGASFGYLCYYSGSLWYSILAHFLNNGIIVCFTYYLQKHNMPLNKADEPIGFPWYGYLISAIITIALFKFFKDNAARERKLG